MHNVGDREWFRQCKYAFDWGEWGLVLRCVTQSTAAYTIWSGLWLWSRDSIAWSRSWAIRHIFKTFKTTQPQHDYDPLSASFRTVTSLLTDKTLSSCLSGAVLTWSSTCSKQWRWLWTLGGTPPALAPPTSMDSTVAAGQQHHPEPEVGHSHWL